MERAALLFRKKLSLLGAGALPTLFGFEKPKLTEVRPLAILLGTTALDIHDARMLQVAKKAA